MKLPPPGLGCQVPPLTPTPSPPALLPNFPPTPLKHSGPGPQIARLQMRTGAPGSGKGHKLRELPGAGARSQKLMTLSAPSEQMLSAAGNKQHSPPDTFWGTGAAAGSLAPASKGPSL